MEPVYVGWLSLLPPLLAIALALITKEVIVSLMSGILLGTFIYAVKLELNPVTGTVKTALTLMAEQCDINIILFLALLGALVAVMTLAGGSRAYGRWAASKLKSRRSSLLATAVLGAIIFIDDYFNCLTVGTVMKPVTDKYKVSRAKLAYIIDATAAPVCIIAPVSSWAAAVGSYVRTTGAFENDLMAFAATIPYNLYAILSLVMVLLICIFNVDFGPMARAEEAVRRGKSDRVEGETREERKIIPRGKVADMIVPVAALIVFAVLAMLENGGYWSGDPALHSVAAAFGNCDAAAALVIAGFGALLVAFLMFLPRRLMTIKGFMDGVIQGIKSMVPAFVILILAWTISGVCRELLLTGDYVKTIVEQTAVAAGLLPLMIFLIAAFLSFAMGTAWGTFGILIPIVVSACSSFSPAILTVSLSATLAGSVFGDHCSPISDTTILSSTGAGCDHLKHVATQMPYAICVAACSGAGYLAAGLSGGNLILTWLVGGGTLVASVFFLHQKYK